MEYFWIGFEKQAFLKETTEALGKLKQLPGKIRQKARMSIARGKLNAAQSPAEKAAIKRKLVAEHNTDRLERRIPLERDAAEAAKKQEAARKRLEDIYGQNPQQKTQQKPKTGMGWGTKAAIGTAAVGVPSVVGYTAGAAHAQNQSPYDQSPQYQ